MRATFGSMKRAINQHRQNYPMATVRMSSIEVLHEMFIVSSDPLLALVTKSAQRLTPHRPGGTDTAAPGTRHFLARRTDRFPAGLRRGRCNMIPREERPALRGSGMERSQGEPDTDAVRAELRAWLAEHLTPKVVEAAERVPRPTT